MSTRRRLAVFSVLVLSLSYPCLASNWAVPAHSWGGTSEDSVDSIAVDSSGNVYVAGYTDSFGAGGHDVLITKYDPSGAFIWAKTWGGAGVEYATSIKVGPDGLLYVTGPTSSFGAGWYDLFLLQLDTDGNLRWGTTWGGSSYDAGYDIAFDATGNIYVVGESYSVSPCCAVILLKFSTGGALLQPAISYKGPANYDSGYSLTVDSQFNVIITGISWDYSIYPLHNSILILKYAPDGSLVWQENWATPFPGQDESDGFHSVTTDAANNIYLASRHSTQCANFDFSQCDFDALVLKLDANGAFQWTQTWGIAGAYDSAQSVAVDSGSNIVVAGMENQFGAGGASPQLFILGYDTNGNPLSQIGWSQGTLQRNHQDSPIGMVLDSNRSVYTASAALNNTGAWASVTANAGSFPNSLISNSYSPGTPVETTMIVTNPTVLQTTGVKDNGGGVADAFVSQYRQEIGTLPTKTTIGSSANPSFYARSATVNTRVLPIKGFAMPTGTVTFLDGGKILGSSNLNAGEGSYIISNLATGLHSITVLYGGDLNYAPSVSPVLKEQINQATSATALSSSSNPSYLNVPVTLSVKVTGRYGGTPTGSVTFEDEETVIGTAQLINAQAVLNTTFVTAGNHSIEVAYSGDSNYIASTSSPLAQTVISNGVSLVFPWPSGGTPYTAPIFSAFDHTLQDGAKQYGVYGCDGTVTAYTGETGNKIYGANASGCLVHPGYAQDSQYAALFVNSNYQGSGKGVGTSKGKAATDFLNYDGHPGIDYGAPYGSTIVAATPGIVHYPSYCMLAQTKAMANNGGEPCAAVWQNDYIGGDPDEFNVLELDPSNAIGYKLFYLHLSTHPRTISLQLKANTTGLNFVATPGGAVPLKMPPNCTQTPPIGNLSISGQVLSNGLGLVGVRVTLIGTGVATSGALQLINPDIATTDSQGNYSFTSLPAGFYHIEAAMNGYTFAAQNPHVLVQEGQTVGAGDVIALSGNSGNCIGPHLHFEVQEQTTPAQQKVVAYSYIPVDPYGWDGDDPNNPDPYPAITGGMQNLPLWTYSPFVTGITPTFATANTSFPLTITGTGFDSGAADCLILKGGNLQQCIQGTVRITSGNQMVVQETLNAGTYFVRVENGDTNKSNWKLLVIQ